MLTKALQKANTAVQLDNAHNFQGARQAYAEACDLLQQVLQRTSADEDKRKLEAIVRARAQEAVHLHHWLTLRVAVLTSDYSVAHIRVGSTSLIKWDLGMPPTRLFQQDQKAAAVLESQC